MLVCWEEREAEPCSVSAVPAVRVTARNIIDESIGDVCKVLVGGKKHPARIAAIGKLKCLYTYTYICTCTV